MVKLPRRQFLCLVAGTAAFPTVSRIALAQMYPARPVRVIVPYGPGGPTDIVGRLIAQKLSERLGTQFYVENFGGGGGNIGIAHAAKAPPDGYTMLVVPPNIVVNPILYERVSYDPIKDFNPVTVAVTSKEVLVVYPSLPAQTVQDLVALIKANPGKYSYASGGIGTPPHLLGELFRLSLGLDVVHVPFNSGGLAIGSVVAGHTPLGFSALAPTISHIEEGKLRALAVASKTRSQILPAVSTMAEAGYPEIEGDAWFAILVPAGTPKEIVALLNRAIIEIMAGPDMKERMATLGYEPLGNTPEESAALLSMETAKWTKIIRGAGIKAE
jgi:tripartite-type tricarboxylate transporter receptor subunit TctC